MTEKSEITAYVHCAECLKELESLKGISPQEYQQIEAGYTPTGFQIWCKRHKLSILRIDFKEMKD